MSASRALTVPHTDLKPVRERTQIRELSPGCRAVELSRLRRGAVEALSRRCRGAVEALSRPCLSSSCRACRGLSRLVEACRGLSRLRTPCAYPCAGASSSVEFCRAMSSCRVAVYSCRLSCRAWHIALHIALYLRTLTLIAVPRGPTHHDTKHQNQ